jgi:hypothetical protein
MIKRAKLDSDTNPYIFDSAHPNVVVPYLMYKHKHKKPFNAKKYYDDTSYHNIAHAHVLINMKLDEYKEMHPNTIMALVVKFALQINVQKITHTDKNRTIHINVPTKNMREELSTIVNKYYADSFGLKYYIDVIEVFYGYINTNYNILKDNVNNLYFYYKNNNEKIIVASFSSENTTFTFYTVYSNSIDEL